MKKKKIKIKWKNISLLIILLLCAIFVIHDIYMIIVKPWFDNILSGWTWYGFITFILALFVGGAIIDYFSDEINRK